jgi:hypothetical protein
MCLLLSPAVRSDVERVQFVLAEALFQCVNFWLTCPAALQEHQQGNHTAHGELTHMQPQDKPSNRRPTCMFKAACQYWHFLCSRCKF